jgi:ribosome biogenesis GTPase
LDEGLARRLAYGRIVEEQRGLYRIAGDVEGWAEVGGRFRHETVSAADFPAVGDWVGVRASGSGFQVSGSELLVRGSEDQARHVIDCLLTRRSVLSRAAAGDRVEQQVLAANVDTVFLVSALTQELNVRRIERYLTMVWEAGAVPVVLLNKADLSPDPMAAAESIRARLPLIDVLAVSALHDGAMEALTPYLRPAHTITLLGSSGVGKSTLANRLLGRDAFRVHATRESDGKGRHTTTSRHLVELPGGALLIDTPGMRELQLWSDGSAVDGAFDDVAALAAECRFADCAHGGEPGCAVQAAIGAGSLEADRLANYQRLARETAFEDRKHDKAAAAEHNRQWKAMHRAQKAMYKTRERLE